ncbi:MAG TPA: phage tail protein, partial [Croceibacterium sp.]
GEHLAIRAADTMPAEHAELPEAAVDRDDESFGGVAGRASRRQADAREIPDALHYYDTARDYQAGLQRADGRARPGRGRLLGFPGALDAATARGLANGAAERAGWARETLAWRVAELDPALAAGQVVRAPGRDGVWRIESWEWREHGVELELRRLPRGPGRTSPADAGRAMAAPDLVATPTALVAFEAPWDGTGEGTMRRVLAAASSITAGWTGAALFADHAGELVPLGSTGSRRSAIGHTTTPLPPSPAMRLEIDATVEIELVSEDFELTDAAAEALANGANRALIGGETVQFAQALALGGGAWRLSGLLRGRGGTEAAAQAGHPAAAPFVLLDERPVAIDPAKIGPAADLVAIGLADSEPVSAGILNPGLTLRPLTPVHPRCRTTPEDGLVLDWTRRARGAWAWPDGIELPLNEQAEAYLIGLGPPDGPDLVWQAGEPRLELAPAQLAALAAAHSGKLLWVRQVGSFAVSDPLLLTVIA